MSALQGKLGARRHASWKASRSIAKKAYHPFLFTQAAQANHAELSPGGVSCHRMGRHEQGCWTFRLSRNVACLLQFSFKCAGRRCAHLVWTMCTPSLFVPSTTSTFFFFFIAIEGTHAFIDKGVRLQNYLLKKKKKKLLKMIIFLSSFKVSHTQCHTCQCNGSIIVSSLEFSGGNCLIGTSSCLHHDSWCCELQSRCSASSASFLPLITPCHMRSLSRRKAAGKCCKRSFGIE